MPKMSYEGLLGAVIALIVVVLDQAGVKNAYVLWIAFVIALGLCLDAAIRSTWEKRRKIWGSAAILLSFGLFASYLVYQLHSEPQTAKSEQQTIAKVTENPPAAGPTDGNKVSDSVAVELKRAKTPVEFSFEATGEAKQKITSQVSPISVQLEPVPTEVRDDDLPKGVPVAGGTIAVLRFGQGFMLFDTRGVPRGTRIRGQINLYTENPQSQLAAAPNSQKKGPRTPTRILEPAVGIKQHGTANGAVGGGVEQGPCSNLQIGGSNNQATANCGAIERHLSDQQKTALRSLIVPKSIKVTLTMTNEGDAQSYGREIINALNLAPENYDVGLMWSRPGPPQGITVRIHDANEPQTLQELGGTLARVIGAQGLLDNRVPAGEVKIMVGRDPSKE